MIAQGTGDFFTNDFTFTQAKPVRGQTELLKDKSFKKKWKQAI